MEGLKESYKIFFGRNLRKNQLRTKNHLNNITEITTYLEKLSSDQQGE
jgi:hypothetical protein